jgi:excisionase family DNA binding protein
MDNHGRERKHLVNASHIAKLLDVSPRYVRMLASENRIPAFLVGTRWRFDAEAVLDAMKLPTTRHLAQRQAEMVSAPSQSRTDDSFVARLRERRRLRELRNAERELQRNLKAAKPRACD